MSFFSKNKFSSDASSLPGKARKGFFGSGHGAQGNTTPTQHPKGVAPKAFSFNKKARVANEQCDTSCDQVETNQSVETVRKNLSLTSSPEQDEKNNNGSFSCQPFNTSSSKLRSTNTLETELAEQEQSKTISHIVCPATFTSNPTDNVSVPDDNGKSFDNDEAAAENRQQELSQVHDTHFNNNNEQNEYSDRFQDMFLPQQTVEVQEGFQHQHRRTPNENIQQEEDYPHQRQQQLPFKFQQPQIGSQDFETNGTEKKEPSQSACFQQQEMQFDKPTPHTSTQRILQQPQQRHHETVADNFAESTIGDLGKNRDKCYEGRMTQQLYLPLRHHASIPHQSTSENGDDVGVLHTPLLTEQNCFPSLPIIKQDESIQLLEGCPQPAANSFENNCINLKNAQVINRFNDTTTRENEQPMDDNNTNISTKRPKAEVKNDFPSESRKLLFDIKSYREQLIELDRSGLEIMLSITESHSSAILQISNLQYSYQELQNLEEITQQIQMFILEENINNDELFTQQSTHSSTKDLEVGIVENENISSSSQTLLLMEVDETDHHSDMEKILDESLSSRKDDEEEKVVAMQKAKSALCDTKKSEQIYGEDDGEAACGDIAILAIHHRVRTSSIIDHHHEEGQCASKALPLLGSNQNPPIVEVIFNQAENTQALAYDGENQSTTDDPELSSVHEVQTDSAIYHRPDSKSSYDSDHGGTASSAKVFAAVTEVMTQDVNPSKHQNVDSNLNLDHDTQQHRKPVDNTSSSHMAQEFIEVDDQHQILAAAELRYCQTETTAIGGETCSGRSCNAQDKKGQEC